MKQKEFMQLTHVSGEMRCCICSREIDDFLSSRNAQPVKIGRCCIECDDNIVLPTRIMLLEGYLQRKSTQPHVCSSKEST